MRRERLAQGTAAPDPVPPFRFRVATICLIRYLAARRISGRIISVLDYNEMTAMTKNIASADVVVEPTADSAAAPAVEIMIVLTPASSEGSQLLEIAADTALVQMSDGKQKVFIG
jgi:hypothetical protein